MTLTANFGWTKIDDDPFANVFPASHDAFLDDLDTLLQSAIVAAGGWTVVEVAGDYTADPGEYVVVTGATADVAITMPTGAGELAAAKKADDTADKVTVLLGGGNQTVMYEVDHVRVTVGDGTVAHRLADVKPYGYADYLDTNPQTDSYTLVKSDAGKVVRMDKATAVNLTVPPASSVAWVTGTTIEVYAAGAGQVTLVAGSGVTINSPGGALKSTEQYATMGLRYEGSDVWVASGSLTV